ncbi:ribonuclease H-like domain-containing protein [Burkholderia ambifaria]|uniref:ribonuclease H-like domain-containing protein n=1 Tax=Burkholderia ambifaria TaxID=152480 RepID=UPI00158B4F64|nr:ribonuclease H-like domain-containing protein [Burkholderia ambifaria]
MLPFLVKSHVRFDAKKINARFILLGMPPPSPFRVVDTMLEARKHFGFTSNKLEWLTDKLCKTHKKKKHAKFPGFELWRECLKGNPEAWDEMRSYNTDDVLSLEELYLVMRPWMSGHLTRLGRVLDPVSGSHVLPMRADCSVGGIRRGGRAF